MLLKPQEFREWLCRNTSNNNEIITDQQDVRSAVAQSLFYRLPLEYDSGPVSPGVSRTAHILSMPSNRDWGDGLVIQPPVRVSGLSRPW